MINSLPLQKPVLFLEFYIREVIYTGKNTASKFPAHTLFYQGKSLAIPNPDAQRLARYYKDPFGGRKIFGYDSGQPCLVNDSHVVHYFVEQTLKKERLDTIWIRGEEFFKGSSWYRNYDRLQLAYSHQLPYLEVAHKAPYRFSVLTVNEQGEISTNFPRREVIYQLEVGQTFLFLCREEEFQSGEWQSPNTCLLLYVKNHGLHQRIKLVAPSEINRFDSASLCEEAVKIRDHRKSRLKIRTWIAFR